MITKDTSFDKGKYLLENFQRALNEGWIDVYYQPIVRTANGRVCEEEALARWDDPIMGIMNPEEFVPILEAVNAITVLDMYVLERMLEKMNRQREEGLFVVPSSFNLSQIDFFACDIVEEVTKRVDEAGFEHSIIALEVNESAVSRNNEQVISQLERFHELGFKIWMDDYGSGNSSPVLLQQIHFDLLKVNVHLVNQITQSESSRVVLTELIRMALALGVETAAEGVESQEQVDFLKEIGCAKLQGFYYCRPIPMDVVFGRYRAGKQIGFENPAEAEYYSLVGKISLYDMSFLKNNQTQGDDYFDAMPMAIIEANDKNIHIVRANKNFNKFLQMNFPEAKELYLNAIKGDKKVVGAYTMTNIRKCAKDGKRRIIDERTPDGKIFQVLMQRVAINEVTGMSAIAFIILSVLEKQKTEENLTYNYIARALSEDYIYLFFVDMKTGEFVEYSSDGKNRDISVERRGKNFFKQLHADGKKQIYKPDVEEVLPTLTKENIEKNLDEHGVFTLTYRMYLDMKPTYVNLKAVRLRTDEDRIIIGVNNVDVQMRRQEALERVKEERLTYSRISALAGDLISIYTVDPETDNYEIYKTSSIFQNFETKSSGEDFFKDTLELSVDCVYYEDLEGFKKAFSKANVMRTIEKNGMYVYIYRLAVNDSKNMYVCLKIVLVEEMDGPRLLVGLTDVDDQKRKEIQYEESITVAEKKANIDELTGVKNRKAYSEAEEKLNEEIKAKKAKKYAIVVCDMNGLKEVNDTMGHLAGDKYIKEGCQIICNTFSHSPVFRVGGDEFAVIVQGKDLANLDYLLSVIDDTNEENKAEGRVTMAAGAAYGQEGKLVGEIFEMADANMYIKKKRMKNAY